jgi:hypothetical protein
MFHLLKLYVLFPSLDFNHQALLFERTLRKRCNTRGIKNQFLVSQGVYFCDNVGYPEIHGQLCKVTNLLLLPTLKTFYNKSIDPRILGTALVGGGWSASYPGRFAPG